MSSSVNSKVEKSFCSFPGKTSVKFNVHLSLLLLVIALLVSRFLSLGQVSTVYCPLVCSFTDCQYAVLRLQSVVSLPPVSFSPRLLCFTSTTVSIAPAPGSPFSILCGPVLWPHRWLHTPLSHSQFEQCPGLGRH